MRQESFAIHCVFPDGEENFVRNGPIPGEGPVVRFSSRNDAQKTLSFMKMGMEEGEDFESLAIVPWRLVENDPDLSKEEKKGIAFTRGGYE